MTVLVAVVVAAAVLAVGVVLPLRRRERRGVDEVVAHAAREATMWQFIERSLDTWSLEGVIRTLGDTLETSLGLGTTILMRPGDQGWTALRLRDSTPAPAPRPENLFAWFRHNPELVLTSDLADGRYGGMRLALEELTRLYAADALLPIAHRDQLFGVVACGSLGRPFDEGERDFLRQLHLEAAAIAANARLYHEAAAKLSLQREVGAAAAVQQALRPQTGSQLLANVMVACHYMGTPGGASDLFAAFEHDGSVTLIVGDIVGRGVAASMLAAVAKGCCDAAIGADVGDLLGILNQAIFRPGPKRPEMRCLALTIDPARREVRAASAGAPFPYIVGRRDGAVAISSVVARGPLLGDQAQVSFPVVTHPFGPEDSLVLFTPGLIVAESPERQAYGERRLLRALRGSKAHEPAWLLGELVADLGKFTGGRPLRDEILLVVARPE